MTEEKKKRLANIKKEMCEKLKLFIELMSRVWEQLKELIITTYNSLKAFLTRKVSIRTKSYKKGTNFVHSYKKLEFWKELRLSE